MKLTTDYLFFTERIKQKLLQVAEKGLRLTYLEFAALPQFPRFSIQWIEEESHTLVIKKAVPDVSNLPGIYDMDAIMINVFTKRISAIESQMLDELFSRDFFVQENSSIVLDGSDYLLIIGDKRFEWFLPSQIDQNFSTALNYLKKLAMK